VKQQHLILGVGELLWDILPAGQRTGGNSIENSSIEGNSPAGGSSASEALTGFLGGAPANFTVMAGRLGNHAAILSRIGRDQLGRQAIDLLDPMPIDAGPVQVDHQHPTGRVTVEFSEGEPGYRIQEHSAWDYLELTDEWIRLAERADAICFGSLAQRSRDSRQTIQTLAAESSASCIRVFDVNLRAPYYSAEVVQESIELASVLKLNESELPLVLSMLGLSSREEPESRPLRLGAGRLLNEFPSLEMIAVTRGDRGSLLVRRGEWDEHPGISVKVADPIGCGDAFTAAMTHYMLRGAGLKILNEAGNRWGAWVASQSGAMPVLPDDVRSAMASAIEG
jgi:fructokinase